MILFNSKLLHIEEGEVSIVLTFNADNNCGIGNKKIDISKYDNPKILISGAALSTDYNYTVSAFFNKANNTIYASRYGKAGTILVKYFVLH